MLAMDQQALDEHVRATDDLDNVDDFMGRMFRNGSQGRDPLISHNASSRCNISMTRPTTIPGVSPLHQISTTKFYVFPLIRTTWR